MSRTSSGPDRRRAGRRTPAPADTLSRIRLRAGSDLRVVDLSDIGLMAEGTMRLLPGTHVGIHLTTRHGRSFVRGQVVRAFVCQVSAEGIRYRGAVAFERAVDTTADGYVFPGVPNGPETETGKAYPVSAAAVPNAGAADMFRPEMPHRSSLAPALE